MATAPLITAPIPKATWTPTAARNRGDVDGIGSPAMTVSSMVRLGPTPSLDCHETFAGPDLIFLLLSNDGNDHRRRRPLRPGPRRPLGGLPPAGEGGRARPAGRGDRPA